MPLAICIFPEAIIPGSEASSFLLKSLPHPWHIKWELRKRLKNEDYERPN